MVLRRHGGAPLNQWQLFDAWISHGGRAPYAPVFPGVFDWFARWGYVGVHMFIAASVIGHALAPQGQAPSWAKFMLGKLRKIWLPSAISVLVFAVVGPKVPWTTVLAKLSWVSYLEPGQFFAINSPLWFLVLVFQYYALLPLLRRVDLGSRGLWVASVVLAWLARWWLGTEGIAGVHPYLAHACVLIWLPALLIGMHLVQRRAGRVTPAQGEPIVYGVLAAVLLIVFLAGQASALVYPLADSALALAFVLIALSVRAVTLPAWVGAVSAASFYIYLYHRPLVAAALSRGFRVFGDHPVELAWASLACMLAALMVFAALVGWRRPKVSG